jgi:hypothetical protein
VESGLYVLPVLIMRSWQSRRKHGPVLEIITGDNSNEENSELRVDEEYILSLGYTMWR